jgi:8-oxo-dGTP diphosphatase
VAHGVTAAGDGDGWVHGTDGVKRWGRFGAAGLLLRAPDDRGDPLVLMQHRAPWTHNGDRWGLPGGARHSDESTAAAALREAAEEAGVDPDLVRVRGQQTDQPGGDDWSYTTVIADATEPISVQPNQESAELAWVPESEVEALDLHPAFALTWPGLRAPDTRLVVDAANVVGSRPDGWWRDRAGAAERLLREVAAAAPGVFEVPGAGFHWVRRPVVVLEGMAKSAPDVPGVEVVRAPGSGDDTIVDVARRPHDTDSPDAGSIVVTSDRGLRARLPKTARAIGPSLLRAWLNPPGTARGASR